MLPFAYEKPKSLDDAVKALADEGAVPIAGGTTMIDLMKLYVLQPPKLVDIGGLPGLGEIEETDDAVVFGALVRMADAAEHPLLKSDYPALSEALWLAASPQIRNMATLGGNVLQRTRCPYFRDTSYRCNRRVPGSGCDAIGGINRLHAVLGTSETCIASYPGDWAVALAAFDTEVDAVSRAGKRTIAFADLHLRPDDHPERVHALKEGEVITHVRVKKTPLGKASTYYKVRDRESYAFALASVAAALVMDGETVKDVRLGLGGVASVPWRAREAEDGLKGQELTPETARRAGETAFRDARTYDHNAFKVPLGVETVVEALMSAKTRA
ncbi:MAG: xanthine dehydrogenase family protein subunit M [Geminicoccaceae bacterium]|nr:xanthine dehydrogenase family protein subunit M [Geminicoccaceae bacterium]